MSGYVNTLNLRLASPRGIEELVAIATVISLIYAYREQFAVAVYAGKEGGKIKSIPTHFFARIVTPIHFCALFITPVAYLFGVAFNGFNQPTSFYRICPSSGTCSLGPGGILFIRLGGIAASLIVWKCMSVVFHYLGSQWHYLGLREKPKIVSSGPYGWVRHPLYTGFLTQELCQIAMYWSWAPLIAFGLTLLALMIKIPIEEKIIEDDKIVGKEYQAYKIKVPSRIIPGFY